jgi:hypothetical protein
LYHLPVVPNSSVLVPNSSVRYDVETYSHIVGSLITTHLQNQIDGCKKKCNETPACQAFDFNFVYNRCSLYETVERKEPLYGYISGVRKK